ncbi:alpha/beta hydrolase [Kineosporia succinea]|uniref:Alpha-beta hydrolase superfamily lysophospholipase n=1 Tax=Kineosporia succinea TaxID=84632 RepID=A0ABT9NX27_9ACTN|nr:alpha/beta hydrolase [Kineosporia succinea]MDP9824979.1 alpha-beta hydrolase superfamily lysophospholipase [Kineosporia succinea]
MSTWTEDLLGDGYERRTLELGPDPDGEGRVTAVLVRRTPPAEVRGAVLYVHGFSDYFFQTAMADFFTERGFAFHALDLRKCGRARVPGQTAHYAADLSRYDVELDQSLALIAQEHPGTPVTLVAHSTGGLILPLYLHRRRPPQVKGLVLNSPWFDMQGRPWVRGPGTWLIRAVAKTSPLRVFAVGPSPYGGTLHISGTGEWDFDLALKPLNGFPATAGWLNAIRRGHARLHRGLDIGVPSLVLRSDKSDFTPVYSEASDRADGVLDVRQIARWAGCLGGETTVVPIEDARHDVFLSLPDVRVKAYDVVADWLDRHPALRTGAQTHEQPGIS